MMTNAIARKAVSLLIASGINVNSIERTGFRRDTGATYKIRVVADWLPGTLPTVTVDRVSHLHGYNIPAEDIAKLKTMSEAGVC
jgi:hypothetical protein